ncbi:hypothetical protein Aph01nite_10570 [Acrocarpospora phusangensis]|uniref:Uncharacterized protein n=1 Tax=Acrocarpospora phusangensis TaxID=1070424 RepID=A0A919Q5N2_9ACTN|nr:hypothetical protein [Acrocarpospora phusangensis]GIH22747.1 hypothetical protein Aph01nite_10570 [Acrocarpospora phusangensis]
MEWTHSRGRSSQMPASGCVPLRRLRESTPREAVLADGFSCRTQIHRLDSGGREGMHLAELIAAGSRRDSRPPGVPPERTCAPRPAPPGVPARAAAVAGACCAVLGVLAAIARVLRRKSVVYR